jgi:hypothetical protein
LAIVDLSRSKAGFIEKAYKQQKDIYPILPKAFFLKLHKDTKTRPSWRLRGFVWDVWVGVFMSV